MFTKDDVAEGFQHLGLLSETKEMYVCEGAKSFYCFHHLSIQEFLAAWHVSHDQNLIKDTVSKFPSMSMPHLYPFVLFLAGLNGCKYLLNLPTDLMLHCFYEAQDPTDTKLLLTSSSVSLESPLDMYVFGYALVHAPVQWSVTIGTPLDMLASSIANHLPSGHKLLGEIKSLRVTLVKCINLLFDGERLPQDLLQSVTELHIESKIIKPYQDQLLYRALRIFSKVKEIELCFCSMTAEGMQDLCKLLSNSHTVECVTLFAQSGFRIPLQYGSQLMTAVLSCPAVKSIRAINIPFKVQSGDVNSRLQNIGFYTTYLGKWIHSDDLKESLFCLADLCKLPSMKTLKVGIRSYCFIPAYSTREFLARLRERIPSMDEPELDGQPFINLYPVDVFM